MKKLELPKTIRTPRLDEVPNDKEIRDTIFQASQANIIEGYVLRRDIPSDSLFSFYAEINVDNSRLWQLVQSLLLLMPNEIALIYGHIDEKPTFSSYLIKDTVIKHITPYKSELSQDGFLEFGFIYNDDEMLLEIFIKKAKYIQFWGNALEPFLNTMAEFGLREVDDLEFIDEYPMVTEALSVISPGVVETSELLAKLGLLD